MEYALNEQRTPDRIFGINVGTTGFFSSFSRIPFFDGLITKPESDASSIYQRLAILLPVADAVLVFLTHNEGSKFSYKRQKFIDFEI